MIAYCGLDCLECEGCIVTQENDDDKRAAIARKWSTQYNTDIKPEQIKRKKIKHITKERIFYDKNIRKKQR